MRIKVNIIGLLAVLLACAMLSYCTPAKNALESKNIDATAEASNANNAEAEQQASPSDGRFANGDNQSEPQSSANKSPASKTNSKQASPAKSPSKAGEKSPTQANPAENQILVTLSIDCKNLYSSNPGLASKFSGNGIMLENKTLTLVKNSTVYDALNASGVSFVGKAYISSIAGLSEKDGGPESGWAYLVNGVYANKGVTAYTLKSGDVISFRYTLNFGKDVR